MTDADDDALRAELRALEVEIAAMKLEDDTMGRDIAARIEALDADIDRVIANIRRDMGRMFRWFAASAVLVAVAYGVSLALSLCGRTP